MSNIQEHLERIRTAVYGIEVRDAIHDSIKECYTDVTNAKTLADNSTAAANSAASNANSKASMADIAASNANAAADKSNVAVINANAAADNANEKSALANAAASNANVAAVNANASRDEAIEAAADASAAAKAANTSATNAEEKAALAQQAANSVNSAKEAASTAAELATGAADKADNAASHASEKALNAEEAAMNANNATSNANTARDEAIEAADRANAAAEVSELAATTANTAAKNADTAASNANTARDAANNAATNANAAIVVVNTAVTNANTAASNANEKATLADNAASNANTARDAANNAATNANASSAIADMAAQNANEKADAASTAAKTADTASQGANNARDAANEAAAKANTAATNANNAASSSDLAVTECNTAIYNANVAAASADRASDRADAAALMIEGLSVTSQSVGPDGMAEAVVSEVDGHKNIHFTLRQGATGAPYIIKGDAYETLEELESTIDSPAIGDQYNVGTEPPYNVYRWTGTRWEDQGPVGMIIEAITDGEIDAVESGETLNKTSKKYLDVSGFEYYAQQKVKPSLNAKVDKVSGKGLSTNDFTTAYKEKIDNLGDNVTALVNTKVDKVSGKGLSTNDFSDEYKTKINQNTTDIGLLENAKVDKVSGKGLSTNDFTTAYKEKIDNLDDSVTALVDTKMDEAYGQLSLEIADMDILEEVGKTSVTSNLCDEVYEWGGLNDSGGEITYTPENCGIRTANYLPVEGGRIVIWNADKSTFGNITHITVMEYGAGKNLIRYTSAVQNSLNKWSTSGVTLDTNTAFIKFYGYRENINTDLNAVKLNLVYVENIDEIWTGAGDTFKYVPHTHVESAGKFVPLRKVQSPLTGKKIVYDGDSIAESRLGSAYNGGGYAKLIADAVGGTYQNFAKGGARLTTKPADKTYHSVVDNLTELPLDGDLYCFEGGINDYWTEGMQLGSFDKTDFNGTLDASTVCGALETIFRYALNTFNGKPICFVITHKIQNTAYRPLNNNSTITFEDYRNAMVGICQKYSIPFYDAFSESGLNGWNTVQNNTYLTSNTNGTADGCHPNEEGYKRYYVPQLIALFERIMPR